MDQVYCFHGAEQRAKFGVDVDENGVEVCRRCRRPVLESLMPRTTPDESPALLLATVAEIAGCRIGGYRGLVSASVTERGSASTARADAAMAAALGEVRRQGASLGANAVVGLQIQTVADGSAATVMLMGTAVVVVALAPHDA